MTEQAYVSIMASKRNGTLYLGSTDALARQREFQRKPWKRAWKIREIEGLEPVLNSEWADLYDRIAQP